ncbi:hypothetical protein Tco_0165334, partial [Tanacetum coccineum]
MLISMKKALNIRLPLLEHLNRTALWKDGTALLLRLLERCFQLLSFHYLFGLKQLQPHVILRTDQSSYRLMEYHLASFLKGKRRQIMTTYGQAEENNNDQASNASFQEDEFINPFCTRVQET